MPAQVEDCLVANPQVERSRGATPASRFFLYLGRHIGYGVCLEGALKLKEIGYIPTESYAAGEMKHGPIALLDDGSPVVVVANDSPVYGKVVSNIEEVRARGADVIAVATEGNEAIEEIAAARAAHAALRPGPGGRCWRSCRCSCWPTTSPRCAA